MAYRMTSSEVQEMLLFALNAIKENPSTINAESVLGWYCKQTEGESSSFHMPATANRPGRVFANKLEALFELTGWAFVDQTVTGVTEMIVGGLEDVVTASEDYESGSDKEDEEDKWLCPACGEDRPKDRAWECSTCGRCVHVACMQNPPKQRPRGVWLCAKCISNLQEFDVQVRADEAIVNTDKLVLMIKRTMAHMLQRYLKLKQKDPDTPMIAAVDPDTDSDGDPDQAGCSSALIVAPGSAQAAGPETAVMIHGRMVMIPVSPKRLCERFLIPYDYVVPDAKCTNWIFRAERQAIYYDIQELTVLIWRWSHPDGFKTKLHNSLFDTIYTGSGASLRYQITSLIESAPELIHVRTEVMSVLNKFGGQETELDSRNIVENDCQMEEEEEELDEATRQFIEDDGGVGRLFDDEFYAFAVEYMGQFHVTMSSLLLDTLSDASRCSTIADAQRVVTLSLGPEGPVGLCLRMGPRFREGNLKIVHNFVTMLNERTGMNVAAPE